MTAGVLIADHTGADGAVAHSVRGSLIASSLQTLRELGHYDRYIACLPAEFHEQVLFCLASSWLPVEAAMAHYAACDAMELSESELVMIGENVSQRIMGTFLGTMLRSSRTFGASPTPWVPFKQYGRIIDRVLSGGVHRIYELGPKDALIEHAGIRMLRYRYFRSGILGIVRGGVSMFAKTCYVKEQLGAPADAIRISVRWV